MIGLFLTLLVLYAVAAVIGFVAGWRLRVLASQQTRRAAVRDVESLRAALSEAQVRRARGA